MNLPLFPLNTVLFPGMPMRLHIFEERYKVMMRQVLEGDGLFGVVLIRRGQEALGPLAEPHAVGCLAHIVQSEGLPQGRMNLLAVGQERIRTVSLDSVSQPYLMGEVEYEPLRVRDGQAADESAKRLRPSIERYLHTIEQAGNPSPRQETLPVEPLQLALLAAILLQTPPGEKQAYLESPSAEALLDNLAAVYRRELSLLGALLSSGQQKGIGVFSWN
jgi:Lon protease-like protein